MRTVESRPVRGYGLTIYNDGAREVCAFLDGSPVLAPAGVEKDGDRRRIRFAEGTRQLRSMGDIFCPDFEIAGLVRQALNEKLGRDRDAANAFVVTGSRVSRRRCYLFLSVDVRFLKSGALSTSLSPWKRRATKSSATASRNLPSSCRQSDFPASKTASSFMD